MAFVQTTDGSMARTSKKLLFQLQKNASKYLTMHKSLSYFLSMDRNISRIMRDNTDIHDLTYCFVIAKININFFKEY